MGNCQCQAADDAAAVIQHTDGRVETAYWPLSASDVMAANPGHYVAVIITVMQDRSSDDNPSSGGRPVRYLKLLGPDDTLRLGHLHHLVTFEDVLREFGTKRRVRLSKLLARKKEELRRQRSEANSSSSSTVAEGVAEEGVHDNGSSGNDHESYGSIRVTRQGQWRPTLQPIAESATFK